jgi:hypothetical protein
MSAVKDILVIVPSYKRQHKIEECVQAWKDTKSSGSEFLLVLEEKDEKYPKMEGIKVLRGDYGSLCNAWNQGFNKHPDYKYYVLINDDHLFRTQGWEERFKEALKDGGFAYSNDLLQKERLATACAISGDVLRKLGHIAWPELEHLYIDDYWMALGRGINKLYYLPDVIIEHMHPAAGKAVMDAEYQASNSNYDKEHQIFNNWMSHDRHLEIERILS